MLVFDRKSFFCVCRAFPHGPLKYALQGPSRTLQGPFWDTSMMLHVLFRDASRTLTSKGFQGHFKGSSGMPQEGLKDASRMLQEPFNDASKTLQGLVKCASKALQRCFKGPSRILQGCLKKFLRMLGTIRRNIGHGRSDIGKYALIIPDFDHREVCESWHPLLKIIAADATGGSIGWHLARVASVVKPRVRRLTSLKQV